MSLPVSRSLAVLAAAWIAIPVFAQASGQRQRLPQPQTIEAPGTPMERLRLNYALGAGDSVVIRVPQAEEIHDKTFRIDVDGNLFLPQVGSVKAAGLTIEQLEAELARQLRRFYVSPVVTVSVTQYRSEPVFLLGAFKNPGIYPLTGKRTLVEMLSSVGGLQANASRRMRITRKLDQGRIPLPGATEDRDKGISMIEVNVNRLMETMNPEEDIVLKPYDMLRVNFEEMVYVSGEVLRVGALPMNDRDSISVIQAIAMSGGLGPNAAPAKAKILRPILDTSRRAEIPVNLTEVMNGRAVDAPLLPNDVLMVPRASGRMQSTGRIAMVAIPALISSVIYLAIR